MVNAALYIYTHLQWWLHGAHGTLHGQSAEPVRTCRHLGHPAAPVSPVCCAALWLPCHPLLLPNPTLYAHSSLSYCHSLQSPWTDKHDIDMSEDCRDPTESLLSSETSQSFLQSHTFFLRHGNGSNLSHFLWSIFFQVMQHQTTSLFAVNGKICTCISYTTAAWSMSVQS